MKKLSIDDISEQRLTPAEITRHGRYPIHVLLEDIRSLYNVGSIFRTADAARIEKLILTGITGYPPRKEIDKTALGAVDSVPWSYHRNALTTARELKARGIPLIALEHTDTSSSHWQFDFTFPCCLMVGNEVWGVSDELLAEADAAIEIPMFGAKHSLNVSVAFGVAIYRMLHVFFAQNPAATGVCE